MKTHTHFFLPLVVSSLFVACSTAPKSDEPSENYDEATSSIVGGTASDAAQDSVVLLLHPTSANQYALCTGTLLAPKLVLTARHCVSSTDDSIACNSDGTPAGSGYVKGDYSADSLYVYTGQKYPTNMNAYAARGAKLVTNGATHLCNNDIALIVLDTAITNEPISPVRIDSDVKLGELTTTVGWGITQNGGSIPSTRQQRTGVPIVSVASNEFNLSESACSGDSGGPAFSSANAVLGVVSRGGTCQGSTARPIYTKLSSFKSLLLSGYQLAGAQPWVEGTTSPGSDAGTPDASAPIPDAGTPDASPPDAGTSASDPQQLCVDTINAYRATLGLPALARWRDAESCVSGEAAADMANNTAHSTFPRCLGGGGGAQSECLGWPMPIEQSITKCLAQMWAGGSSAIANPKYTKVACGYAIGANGKYWAAQDFQ